VNWLSLFANQAETKTGAAYRNVGRFSKFRGFLSTPYFISTLSRSSPSAHWLERDHLLKVVQRLDRIQDRKLLLIDALPVSPVHCSNHQVLIAKDFRVEHGKNPRNNLI